MTLAPNSAEARDIAFHFHSYTNAATHAEVGPQVIEEGKGIYVFDNHGKRYIEAMSGLWSVAVGFGEERLIKAATEQMQKLPYYHNFAHRAHPAAIDLAEKLAEGGDSFAKTLARNWGYPMALLFLDSTGRLVRQLDAFHR